MSPHTDPSVFTKSQKGGKMPPMWVKLHHISVLIPERAYHIFKSGRMRARKTAFARLIKFLPFPLREVEKHYQ